MAHNRTTDAHPTAQDRDQELSPAELAAWRCDLTDPLTWRLKVLAWLWTIGAPLHDDNHRGVAAVRLERHGAATTVVVTRRTPPGAPAVRERWPMTCQPPARPAEPTLSSTGNQ